MKARDLQPKRTLTAIALALALGANAGTAMAEEPMRSNADISDLFHALIAMPLKALRAAGGAVVYTATLPVTTLAGTEPQVYEDFVTKPTDSLLEQNAR